MKALSLFQPLATLAMLTAKGWETRSWRPQKLPTDFCIHATAASPAEYLRLSEINPCKTILKEHGQEKFPFGVILAVADVTEILTTREWTRRFCQRKPSDQAELDYLFGDYSPDRFAWKLDFIRPLKKPIPCKGRQRLWTVTPEVEEEVWEQINV